MPTVSITVTTIFLAQDHASWLLWEERGPPHNFFKPPPLLSLIFANSLPLSQIKVVPYDISSFPQFSLLPQNCEVWPRFWKSHWTYTLQLLTCSSFPSVTQYLDIHSYWWPLLNQSTWHSLMFVSKPLRQASMKRSFDIELAMLLHPTQLYRHSIISDWKAKEP